MKRLMATVLLCACFAGLTGCGKTDTYPLKTEETLTYWMQWADVGKAVTPSMQMTEFSKGLEERTGVKIEYIHPTGGQDGYFELMISSNNLPDIIEYNWGGTISTISKQLSDEKIMDIAPLLSEYAPDYNMWLMNNDEARRLAMTENGECPYFIGSYAEDYQTVFQGPFFRKDWLDELGLAEPETIDEWEIALRAFKEQKGAQAPFSITPEMFDASAIVGAYGVAWYFYQEDEQLKFGPLEAGFRDFVQRMAKWYQEGLLDPMYPMVDQSRIEMNLFSGNTGAGFGYLGADIGSWQKKIKEEQLPIELAGVRNPSLQKAETVKIAPRTAKVICNYAAAVSTQCKSPRTAVQFLNYAYTEEGNRYFNFGIENVSYTIENEIPTYTSLITDNPDMPMANALAMYTRTSYGGPFVKDEQYTIQYYQDEIQQEALEKWLDNDAAQYLLPTLMISHEDVEQISMQIEEVKRYEREMVTKFIIGEEDLNQWDQFIETLQSMGIEELLSVLQRNYDATQKK